MLGEKVGGIAIYQYVCYFFCLFFMLHTQTPSFHNLSVVVSCAILNFLIKHDCMVEGAIGIGAMKMTLGLDNEQFSVLLCHLKLHQDLCS